MKPLITLLSLAIFLLEVLEPSSAFVRVGPGLREPSRALLSRRSQRRTPSAPHLCLASSGPRACGSRVLSPERDPHPQESVPPRNPNRGRAKAHSGVPVPAATLPIPAARWVFQSAVPPDYSFQYSPDITHPPALA
jgi:hypothetical protein